MSQLSSALSTPVPGEVEAEAARDEAIEHALLACALQLYKRFDKERGGFGGAPKCVLCHSGALTQHFLDHGSSRRACSASGSRKCYDKSSMIKVIVHMLKQAFLCTPFFSQVSEAMRD